MLWWEISEGIKSRIRFNAVVETSVPRFVPEASEAHQGLFSEIFAAA
jgi:hypothetical protein